MISSKIQLTIQLSLATLIIEARKPSLSINSKFISQQLDQLGLEDN